MELGVNHVLLIKALDNEALKQGEELYTSLCAPCHGTPEQEGYLSLSRAFWKEPFKSGGDLFGMYQTLTHGLGLMPPWPTLTPTQKYEVSHYVREILVKPTNPAAYVPVTDAYMANLPKPRLEPRLRPPSGKEHHQ